MTSATLEASKSRRNFLQGNFTNTLHQIRPPWAVRDDLFVSLCSSCDDCIGACPEKILLRANNGLPIVNFSRAGCTFCAGCLEVCNTGALQGGRTDPGHAWSHLVRFSGNCLSVSGVICRVCGEHCDVRAIHFSLMTRGRSFPELNSALCTGCGQCIVVCPESAIGVYEPANVVN